MINYSQLKKTCLRNIASFSEFGDVTQTPQGNYIFKGKPNNKILGVAHLDTVLDLKHFYVNHLSKETIVYNAQLDDRLGAYVLLYLLPKLGVKFDLLLTEGEETGQSTAQYFTPDKQYNWMFSFDRHGDDVVMYQYDNHQNRQLLKQAGFKIGIGSFSDIAFLEHLTCSGFNFGVGYEGEHSPRCYAEMDTLEDQISKFLDFYLENQDTYLPVEKQAQYANFYRPMAFYRYDEWEKYDQWDSKDDNLFVEKCAFCKEDLTGEDQIYECCESCAIEHGIFCLGCNQRMSVSEISKYELCSTCSVGEK